MSSPFLSKRGFILKKFKVQKKIERLEFITKKVILLYKSNLAKHYPTPNHTQRKPLAINHKAHFKSGV